MELPEFSGELLQTQFVVTNSSAEIASNDSCVKKGQDLGKSQEN